MRVNLIFAPAVQSCACRWQSKLVLCSRSHPRRPCPRVRHTRATLYALLRLFLWSYVCASPICTHSIVTLLLRHQLRSCFYISSSQHYSSSLVILGLMFENLIKYLSLRFKTLGYGSRRSSALHLYMMMPVQASAHLAGFAESVRFQKRSTRAGPYLVELWYRFLTVGKSHCRALHRRNIYVAYQ
jgi:hypothetical protein